MSAAESGEEKLSCEAYFWAPSSCIPLSPSSCSPSTSTLFLLPLLCSRLCADLSVANYLYLSARSPSLLCALPLFLCVSWNRSISVTLCEHATTPPPLLIDLLSLLLPPSPSLPPSSGKCAWIATLIAALLMLARMPPTVLLCLFLPDVAQKKGFEI